MNKPSPNFLKICELAKIEPGQAERLWLEIWQKAIRNFLNELVKESNFTPQQSQSLLEVLDSIKKNGTQGKSVVDWVFPLLSEEQKIKSSQKFAYLLLDAFQEFYKDLMLNLSSRNLELIESYLNKSYVS